MAENGQLCPICEEGKLTLLTEKNPVEYRGVKGQLDSHYSVCDGCGAELADAQQIRANKCLMTAFKKQVEGLLSGDAVRKI